jgi:hypothetical protein
MMIVLIMKKLAVILSVTLLIAATWFILWMIPPGMDRFEVTITAPDSIQPLETTSIERYTWRKSS